MLCEALGRLGWELLHCLALFIVRRGLRIGNARMAFASRLCILLGGSLSVGYNALLWRTITFLALRTAFSA